MPVKSKLNRGTLASVTRIFLKRLRDILVTEARVFLKRLRECMML